MSLKFAPGQKAAHISIGSFGPARIIPVTVEKVTKTKVTIAHSHGTTREYLIRTDLTGKQEGRHARTSYMYYKEHVEVWTEAHDAMVAARNTDMIAQRQLNAIKDRVAKLHVSERDLIAQLASLLGLNAEAVS